MENVLSGAAAAMNVALKMKNLFNNACTFHHKSYVIFSFAPLFSFRLSVWCRSVCMLVLYLFRRSIAGANARALSPPDDPFTPTQTLRIRLSPSIAAIHIQHLFIWRAYTQHTPIVAIVIVHSSKLSEFLIRLTTQLTVRTNVRLRSVLCCANNRILYVWEKFSIYHRRTDKLYSDENGRTKAKPDPIE